MLPELFAALGRDAAMRAAAEPLHGPTLAWASEQARAHGVHLVAGSFVEGDGDDLFNTSCLVGPERRAGGRLPEGPPVRRGGGRDAASRESDTFSAGPGPVVAALGEGA